MNQPLCISKVIESMAANHCQNGKGKAATASWTVRLLSDVSTARRHPGHTAGVIWQIVGIKEKYIFVLAYRPTKVVLDGTGFHMQHFSLFSWSEFLCRLKTSRVPWRRNTATSSTLMSSCLPSTRWESQLATRDHYILFIICSLLCGLVCLFSSCRRYCLCSPCSWQQQTWRQGTKSWAEL